MAERALATKANAAAKKAAKKAKKATAKKEAAAKPTPSSDQPTRVGDLLPDYVEAPPNTPAADWPAPRRLEWMPVNELPDDDRNPKTHAEGDLDASIKRFGFTTPCEIDERTGKLVAGHGRKAALLRRILSGGGPPDGVMVDDNGRWLVPVVRGWASADDNEAGAYLAAANQLTIAGGWDDTALAALLGGLATTELGLMGTGYTDRELEGLRALTDDDAWDEHGPWDGYGGNPHLSKSPKNKANDGIENNPDATVLWPRIELRVPSPVFEAWHQLLSGYEGADDLAKLTAHLRAQGLEVP